MADRFSGSDSPLHRYAGNGFSPPMRNGEAYPAEDEITLQEILEVLYKWKWTIVATFATVVVLAVLYTFLKTPEYEASSMLYVNKQQSTPALGQLIGLQGASSDIANEVEILQSRTIALGVADRLMDQQYIPGADTLLSVLQQPEDAQEPLTRVDVMRRLQGGYTDIKPVGEGVDLITVTATSIYPKEAALIADLYAAEYVSYNRAMSRTRMAASSEFLSDITSSFRRRLELTEDTLRTFLQQEQVVAPDMEAQYLLQQITDLRGRKYEALATRQVSRRQLELLRNQLERITPEVAAELASSEAIVLQGLKQKVSELATELEATYANNPGLRENPTEGVLKLKQQIEGLKAQIGESAEQLVAQAARTVGLAIPNGALEDAEGSTGLPVSGTQVTLGRLRTLQGRILNEEITLETSQARLGVLDDKLAELQAQVQQIPGKELIKSQLERTLQQQSQVYLSLVKQLQQTRVATQSELGYVTIIDEALVPNKPVSPRVRLNLALGVVLGLMLGVGMAFLRNVFDNEVRAPEELRKHGYSVVGVVPDMDQVIEKDFDGRERVTVDGHAYDTSLIALLNPLSPAAESYRRLRTNLQYSRLDERVCSILVTSSGPGEGKSTTSLNLALTMAQAGRRTAYLDADLRRSTGHQKMGLSREPGLVDLLFEPYHVGPEHFATDVDNFYVIPSGSTVPNPAEIMGAERMGAFIEQLKKEFDVLVIDSPPVLAVTDAQLLSVHCDATVLVCAAGDTEWAMLDHSMSSLRDVGARVAGVVLNRYDPKAAGNYGYGYGYGYGIDEYFGKQPVTRS